jgi:GT2 family glycosyltransferase
MAASRQDPASAPSGGVGAVAADDPTGPRIAVAIVTRDRRERLLDAVARIAALPEHPPIVVADNGSGDGTLAALAERFGARDEAPADGAPAPAPVETLALGRNLGSAARTVAATHLRTPLVAFSDDDSWWDPGALTSAAELFDADPRLGLLAARVVVGPQRREDPTCALMAASPLARDPDPGSGPGIPVIGFVACGAVVRRSAFLAVGGFHPRYGIGGEERLLALDLLAAGWRVRYVPEVVAHHCPPPAGHGDARAARTLRNDLWSIWLRRPLGRVPGATARQLRDAGWRRRSARAGTAAALAGLPWVVRERRPLPASVERAVRTLERASG